MGRGIGMVVGTVVGMNGTPIIRAGTKAQWRKYDRTCANSLNR